MFAGDVESTGKPFLTDVLHHRFQPVVDDVFVRRFAEHLIKRLCEFDLVHAARGSDHARAQLPELLDEFVR